MSCGGNRFQCGITRFQKHSFIPDKPSNLELHNENQKRLNDLLKAREEIDKHFFSSHSNTIQTQTDTMNVISTSEPTLLMRDKTNVLSLGDVDNNSYTSWNTPSTSDYQSITK